MNEETLLAQSILRAGTPTAAPVGTYAEGWLSSVTLNADGTRTATVTGITVDPLLVPSSAWWSWFASEVATMGVGTGGVVGRRVAVLFTAGRQFSIASTVGS